MRWKTAFKNSRITCFRCTFTYGAVTPIRLSLAHISSGAALAEAVPYKFSNAISIILPPSTSVAARGNTVSETFLAYQKWKGKRERARESSGERKRERRKEKKEKGKVESRIALSTGLSAKYSRNYRPRRARVKLLEPPVLNLYRSLVRACQSCLSGSYSEVSKI